MARWSDRGIGSWWRSPAARTRSPCGTSSSPRGYHADGLYLGLGIGEYSDRSHQVTAAFADERGATPGDGRPRGDLRVRHPDRGAEGLALDVRGLRPVEALRLQRARPPTAGTTWSRPATTSTTRRRPCSGTRCGGTRTTSRGSRPCCRPPTGMVKKVKPLHRLSELETAAYAFLRGIDYVVEECPLVAGNTQLRYKEAMNAIEARSPGTKAQFFLGLPRPRRCRCSTPEDRAELVACAACGQPTTGTFCAFCRARAQILGERLAPPEDRQVARGARRRGAAGRALRARGRARDVSEPFGGGRTHPARRPARTGRTSSRSRRGGTFHTHSGTLGHDELLGAPEGTPRRRRRRAWCWWRSGRASPTSR